MILVSPNLPLRFLALFSRLSLSCHYQGSSYCFHSVQSNLWLRISDSAEHKVEERLHMLIEDGGNRDS
jgi:hypothetical protein